MSLRRGFYLAAACVGAGLPGYFLLSYFLAHGPDLGGFLSALRVNAVSLGFALDLVISSVVFWPWLFDEARKLALRHAWVYILINLTVGLSLALPLFLYVRQTRLERQGESR